MDRLRNVLKFLLGNVPSETDQQNSLSILPYEQLLPLDQYVLHCLAIHCKQIEKFYAEFKYNKVVLETQSFVASILSSFYFYLIKDRLYCDSRDSHSRKAAITALFHIKDNLIASISPILPVLSREVSLHATGDINCE